MGLSQFEDFDISPALIFGSFFPPITISCCLHELDLFWQYEPLYLMPMKAIWTWARENGMRDCDTESVFLSVFCVVLFGQNIKNTAQQQDNLFCLHRISHKHTVHSICALKTHQHINAANHSSIFYARMHKTLTTLYKLQLMCERGKSRGSKPRIQKKREGMSRSRGRWRQGERIKWVRHKKTWLEKIEVQRSDIALSALIF